MTPSTFARLREKHRRLVLPESLSSKEAQGLIRERQAELSSLIAWHDSGDLIKDDRETLRKVIGEVTSEVVEILMLPLKGVVLENV